jgi:hypothetical protein
MSAISTSDLDHEERLTHALVPGDPAAFDELYRRYARRLAVYAGRIVGDPGSGEDDAQSRFSTPAKRCGAEPGPGI